MKGEPFFLFSLQTSASAPYTTHNKSDETTHKEHTHTRLQWAGRLFIDFQINIYWTYCVSKSHCSSNEH